MLSPVCAHALHRLGVADRRECPGPQPIEEALERPAGVPEARIAFRQLRLVGCAAAAPPGSLQHKQGGLEALDGEVMLEELPRGVRLREEERQQHELAVLLAAEEQPAQRQFAVRALQDAVVMPSRRAVEVPAAGSWITSCKVGFITATMLSISGRGVKYWPAPDFFSLAFFSSKPS